MSNEEIVEQIQNKIDVTANQERLWKNCRTYVKQLIRKMCGFSNDMEDLEQQGFIGLVTAAMKYDSKEGVKFLTYATYYIKSSIIRYNENFCSCVRVPVYLKNRIRMYESIRVRYKNEKGRFPTKEEYLEELHISSRSFSHLEKTIHNMNAISIHQSISDEEEEKNLADILQDDEDIEELVTYCIYNKELKKALDSALAILDADTRALIQSVYYQRNTRERTAEIFGCSKQNVSEKIGRGFWKILHSSKLKELESFMPDGYRWNEYLFSEYAEMEDADNEFLL